MITSIIFSACVAAVPALSMLFASFALLDITVPTVVEACCQNFCSGLILAAVAKELFPLLSPSSLNSTFDSICGTTVGFILGVCLINGVDFIIDSYDEEKEIPHEFEPKVQGSWMSYYYGYPDYILKTAFPSKKVTSGSTLSSECGTPTRSRSNSNNVTPKLRFRKPPLTTLTAEKTNNQHDAVNTTASSNLLQSEKNYGTTFDVEASYQILATIQESRSREDIANMVLLNPEKENDKYDSEAVSQAVIALATPRHRDRIRESFVELIKSISLLELKSKMLTRDNGTMSLQDCEQIEEDIDKEIHNLQYKLDRARRFDFN